MQFLPPDGCFPFVIMTVDNRAEHLGYIPEIPDVLYGYPQIRKGQILRPTPNTAPLICGACYNTQPEDLLTMA